MKKTLPLIMGATIIFGTAHTQIHAGGETSRMQSSSSTTFSLRDVPYSQDIINTLQDIATDTLHAYRPDGASSIIPGTAVYTPEKFHGTAHNLHRVGGSFYDYLYFPETLPLCKPIITTFIPAHVFEQSRRQIHLSLYEDASFASEQGCKFGTAKDRIEARFDGICDCIMQKKVNSNYGSGTLSKDDKEKFMALCRIVNKWHLFKLLTAEIEKLQKEGKNIADFGFLVMEVTDSDTTSSEPSPDKSIIGPSTFYVKTVTRQ